MNKKGSLLCSLIVIMILLVGLILFLSYYDFEYDEDCLREKAEEYCEERGLEHKDYRFTVAYIINKEFVCVEDDKRTTERTVFKFLESELKECKK